MHSVFICYSHRDKRSLDAIVRHLSPLERDTPMRIWSDREIESGNDWKDDIDRALDQAATAVVLVTQDFVASAFIDDQELPFLLKREEEGKLTLIPVFLNHATLSGRMRRIAEIQGYGEPDKPLLELSRTTREREYVRLAKRIEALSAGTGGRNSAIADRQALPKPSVSPSVIRELVVELDRHGDRLRRQYRRPGEAVLYRSEMEAPWDAAWNGLAPIFGALNVDAFDFSSDAMRRQTEFWGEQLFTFAFGTDEQQTELFRLVFEPQTQAGEGAAAPTALRAPLRVRIVSALPDVARLPWRSMSCRGQPLTAVGWQVDVGLRHEARVDVHTPHAAEMLFCGADVAERLRMQVKHLWQVQGQATPYLTLARSNEEALAAVRSRSPHFVYLGGNLTVREGVPHVAVAQSDAAVPLGELLGSLDVRSEPPQVVYIEGCADVPWSPTEHLADRLPLLFWNPSRTQEPAAENLIRAWLAEWLGAGRDPVDAFHAAALAEKAAGGGACQRAIWSHYRRWNTAMARPATDPTSIRLKLDRVSQKRAVKGDLERLIGSRDLRVMALVIYAEAGNHVAEAHDQFRDFLEDPSAPNDRFALQMTTRPLPPSRERLAADLEAELLEWLHTASPKTDLQSALRQQVNNSDPKRVSVLWMHYGVTGDAPGHRPTMSHDQLRQWIRFAATCLPPICPPDMKIVCTISLEVPHGEHLALGRLLDDLSDETEVPGFWLRPLDPLGAVSRREFRDFLREGHTRCRAAIQGEVADRFMLESQGKFEILVALSERAERDGWDTVLDELRAKQGKVPDRDSNTASRNA